MTYYVDTGKEVRKVNEWMYEYLVRVEGYVHRIRTEHQAVIFSLKGKKG